MQSHSTAQEPTETLTKNIPQYIPYVKHSPTHKHHRKRQCALTVGGAVSALCPWHVPTHFGNVPRAPSRLGSGFMLSRLGDATPRTDQPQPCHSNTSPTSTFYNRHVYRPCRANTYRSVKEQISPYYDSRHRTNYAQKGLYFSHVEHWYWIPSADRREDADRQRLQPVVTVTPSEHWNRKSDSHK